MLVSGVEQTRAACDAALVEWQRSRGRHGSVTLSADPNVTDAADQLVARARAAWTAVNRPNALIGLRATEAGIAAMRELVSLGICVDLECTAGHCDFGRVLEAYMEGLSLASARGMDLGPIRAVATVSGLSPEEAEERALEAWRRAAWLALEDVGANRITFMAAVDRHAPAA